MVERMQFVRAQRNLFSMEPQSLWIFLIRSIGTRAFHTPDSFPDHLTVCWNKSFDAESIVSKAANEGGVVIANEPLPNGSDLEGRLEVVVAPYQCEDADPDHLDMLFLWFLNSR